MKALRSQWLSRITDRVPEQTILLVPGHFFYGHRFAVPAEMAAAEVPAFIELSLEGVSPFPLDQLAWGFVYEREQHVAYAYATSLTRLRQHLGELDPESFFYALPGFLTRYGVSFSQPTVSFVEANGAVSALLYVPGQRLPDRVLSREVSGEVLSDDRILATRDQLAATLTRQQPDLRLEEGVWASDGYSLDRQDRPTFFHQHLTSHGRSARRAHPLPLGQDALWRADLRDSAYKTRQRRERQISHRLWQGAQGLAGLFLLLLILQLVQWGLGGWATLREHRVQSRTPAVDRIEQSDSLATRILESADRSVQPVRMLEVVNEVRPDAVFFTRTRATRYDQIFIQGESRQGIPTVNLYEEALRALPEVSAVTQSAATRGGQTTFEMTVTFVDGSLSSHREPSTPAED